MSKPKKTPKPDELLSFIHRIVLVLNPYESETPMNRLRAIYEIAKTACETGPEGWVFIHQDGRHEADHFNAELTQMWKDGQYHPCTEKEWGEKYRPGCKLVRMRLTMAKDQPIELDSYQVNHHKQYPRHSTPDGYTNEEQEAIQRLKLLAAGKGRETYGDKWMTTNQINEDRITVCSAVIRLQNLEVQS